MPETARYLYAVTRAGGFAPDAGDRGLRDAPLEVVEEGRLAAVVGEVDLAEFGEEPLRAHLEDLAWLEEVARVHDGVVKLVGSGHPVAPMRLATILLDDHAVRSRLAEWHDQLSAALDRVDGRAEWSVKLIAPTRTDSPSSEPEASESAEAATGGGRGAAYLQRKRQQATRRVSDQEQAAEAAKDVHAVLAGEAVAARVLQPQDPRLSGLVGSMVLNAAYLLDQHADDRLRRTTDELARRYADYELVVQGPWPPYSFVELDL